MRSNTHSRLILHALELFKIWEKNAFSSVQFISLIIVIYESIKLVSAAAAAEL